MNSLQTVCIDSVNILQTLCIDIDVKFLPSADFSYNRKLQCAMHLPGACFLYMQANKPSVKKLFLAFKSQIKKTSYNLLYVYISLPPLIFDARNYRI